MRLCIYAFMRLCVYEGGLFSVTSKHEVPPCSTGSQNVLSDALSFYLHGLTGTSILVHRNSHERAWNRCMHAEWKVPQIQLDLTLEAVFDVCSSSKGHHVFTTKSLTQWGEMRNRICICMCVYAYVYVCMDEKMLHAAATSNLSRASTAQLWQGRHTSHTHTGRHTPLTHTHTHTLSLSLSLSPSLSQSEIYTLKSAQCNAHHRTGG